MPQPNLREIKLRDGRTLAYAEYGNSLGQPVIHCHGAPSSRVEGDLILHAPTVAASGLRIIVPDRPGMGRSDFQPRRRITDWPNDVADLATALGFERFAVLAESGGSPYALACAAQLPARVRAVGLIATLAPLDAPGVFAPMPGPLKLMFRLGRSMPPLLGALFNLNLGAMKGGGGARGMERMAASFPEPDRSLLRKPEIGGGFIACFLEACRQGTRGPVLDLGLVARPWGVDLKQIGVPVLLWHGERDANVPVIHGRTLASMIPRCRAYFYPEEAHLSLPLNRQREILGALKAALD